ncbi:hypothetical protein RF11_00074 [Thelohanellus kitauei]|uniref:Uncharacterized protein n=1 Tax=Thelohanellus kitauei TaxID=669202 RepID=A0A0C2NIX6_THEKT|nr:hypothetical protein RF11_00074 [Thelohanellus kitauei]
MDNQKYNKSHSNDVILKNLIISLIKRDKHFQETLEGIKRKDQEYNDSMRALEREMSSLKLRKHLIHSPDVNEMATGILPVHNASYVAKFSEFLKYISRRKGMVRRIMGGGRRKSTQEPHDTLLNTVQIYQYIITWKIFHNFSRLGGESCGVIRFEILSVLMSGKKLKWKLRVVNKLTTAVSFVDDIESMDQELQEALDECKQISSQSPLYLSRINLIIYKIDI